MKHIKEKTRAAEGLSPELAALLEKTRPVEKVRAELERSASDLDRDPEFVAEYARARFVDDICRLMEKHGISRSDLAARLGRSRQYVGRVLNEGANFTIETMAALCVALDGELNLRVQGPGERVVLETQPFAEPQVVVLSDIMAGPERTHQPNCEILFDNQPAKSPTEGATHVHTAA